MFGQKLTLLLLSNGFKIPLFLVSTILVARILGPERLGTIVYLQAIVALLMIVNDLSINHTHIKRVSEGKDFSGCLRTYLLLKGITTIFTLSLFALFIFLSMLGVIHVVEQKYFLIFIILTLSVIINQSANQIMLTTFQARQKVSILALVETVSLLFFSIVGVIILLLTNDLLLYSFTFLLKECLLFILLLFFFVKTFRHELLLFFRGRTFFIRNYLRYALPQMFLIPIGLLNAHFDKVLIRYFLSTYQVGLYAASQRLSIVTQFSKLFASLFFPELSRDYGGGQMVTFVQKVTQAEKYLCLFFFSLSLPLVLFSHDIILYSVGPDFTSATPLFQVFLIYAVFDILVSPHRSVLYASEKNNFNTFTAMGGLFVFLALSVLFVPKSFFGLPGLHLGAIGIILAQLIKTFIIFILYKFFSWRFFRIPFSWTFIPYMGLFALAIAVDQLIIHYGLILRIVIDLSSYLGLLALFKLMTRQDIRYILQKTHLKSVGSFVKDEFRAPE